MIKEIVDYSKLNTEHPFLSVLLRRMQTDGSPVKASDQLFQVYMLAQQVGLIQRTGADLKTFALTKSGEDFLAAISK
ncbi:MAG: hypothetical protein BroJett025_02340 [Patescibacteria group bacterium]|nr:MAG: hypothetical protein BroJett025_02340 [Patescibacteria group bacterium]